jgi:hypothetical protein
MNRRASGISVILAELAILFVILPGVFFLAVFAAPVFVIFLPIMLVWSVAQGAAGKPRPQVQVERHAKLEPAHQHR